MRALRRFLASRGGVVGALLVLLLLALALVPHGDPLAPHIDRGLSALGAPLSPSSGAWLGTDHLGRDVWARLLAGAGLSLEIATLSTALALAIGILVGLTAGYAGGWADSLLMRIVDLFLAFPFVLLAIVLAALLREANLAASSAPVVLTIGIVGWTQIARVVRGKTLSIARSEHVIAARALGASPLRIVVRHVLPNLAGILIVLTVLGFAQNLLNESVLSYLGLGPPGPTWGRMLYEGRAYYRTAPWLSLAPGIAIVTAVVAFNLLGNALRDLLDPKEPR
jgi:ABC-type dipeptide/oligopeptide/nickel transport system permease subunit